MLMIDNPLDDPKSTKAKVIAVIDNIHTALFIIEALIKIIGLGFIHNKLDHKELRPYITSPWNMLDFIVVIAQVAELIIPYFVPKNDASAFKILRNFKSFRALRPLRMVSRNEGMKLVVNALWSSIPSMTNVLIVCLLLLLIMAVLGVNFFKGAFWSCEGLPREVLLTVDGVEDCLALGGSWQNAAGNFDNVGTAMLTLFQMMTTEGWLTVMYSGTDMRGKDL